MVNVDSQYDECKDEEIKLIPPQSIPPNAYFAVEGGKTYPLDEAVINIGRMLDNHLVIDDPRVSRHHAQLRAVDGLGLTDVDMDLVVALVNDYVRGAARTAVATGAAAGAGSLS